MKFKKKKQKSTHQKLKTTNKKNNEITKLAKKLVRKEMRLKEHTQTKIYKEKLFLISCSRLAE